MTPIERSKRITAAFLAAQPAMTRLADAYAHSFLAAASALRGAMQKEAERNPQFAKFWQIKPPS